MGAAVYTHGDSVLDPLDAISFPREAARGGSWRQFVNDWVCLRKPRQGRFLSRLPRQPALAHVSQSIPPSLRTGTEFVASIHATCDSSSEQGRMWTRPAECGNLFPVTGGPAGRYILWHCSILASSEYASLLETEDEHRLQGLAVLPLGVHPCHIEYEVLCDGDWMPQSCTVNVALPREVRTIELRSDHVGGWEVNGNPAPHLTGCSDIDLGWTPATNTVPIRRLDLEIGDSASLVTAWIRFPELDVIANQQHYTRLASDRWRYRSGDYDFELVTDTASGLVLAYGDDLWRAAARS